MNMMTMAMMEEGLAQAFENWPLPVIRPPACMVFEDGFRAGAAWAMRQQEKQGSSQAVGDISPQLVRTLVSQFVVWTQMRDIWLHRRKFGESPRALHYGELPHLWKEFAAEFCSGKVVSQYPAAVEEPEEEA